MIVNDFYEFEDKYLEKKIKVKTNYDKEFIGFLFDVECDEEEEPLDLLCLENENGKDIEIDLKNVISIEIIE